MTDKPKRILVVDDNYDLAENLEEILQTEGFDAKACGSGEDALDALAGQDFGLVLTDMRMPGLSGLEVLHRVRARFPAVPVVIMSAYSDEALLEAARESGALAVIVKPVGFEALIAVVRTALMPHARLLLLEDEAALRVDLTNVLQEEGSLPYGCRTLEEARRFLATVRLDAAIVDLGLPDGDGLELLGELRSSGRTAPMPLIIITGQPERMSSLEALVGDRPIQILAKPFDPARLLARLRSALSES